MRALAAAAAGLLALALPGAGMAAPTPDDLLERARRADVQGDGARAVADATRVVVEAPGSEAARSASALLGRIRLREGQFGEAAWWLERAEARDGTVASLRALAVRSLLREQGLGGGWRAPQDVAASEVRRASGLVRLRSGVRALLDARLGSVVWLGADGRTLGRSELGDVQAAAPDGGGKLVVATREHVVVLDPAHPETSAPFGGLGRFGAVSALAVDAEGTVWVADRKGSRIGRLRPGAAEPATVLDSKAMRVEALAPLPPGRGVILLDGRSGAVIAVDPKGALRPLPALPWGERGKPAALATDAAGQVAVLDGRTGEVVLLDGEGVVRDRLPAPEADRDAPLALALGLDGALELLTGDGRLRRSP
jgi:hypothetical protein